MTKERAMQRIPARPVGERAAGPDNHVRCKFCDQGILPGEVWNKPRECCNDGHDADAAFDAAEAKR